MKNTISEIFFVVGVVALVGCVIVSLCSNNVIGILCATVFIFWLPIQLLTGGFAIKRYEEDE